MMSEDNRQSFINYCARLYPYGITDFKAMRQSVMAYIMFNKLIPRTEIQPLIEFIPSAFATRYRPKLPNGKQMSGNLKISRINLHLFES